MGVVVVVYVIHLACFINSFAHKPNTVGNVCKVEAMMVSELLQMLDIISVRSECTRNVVETEAKGVNRARMPKCNNKNNALQGRKE